MHNYKKVAKTLNDLKGEEAYQATPKKSHFLILCGEESVERVTIDCCPNSY